MAETGPEAVVSRYMFNNQFSGEKIEKVIICSVSQFPWYKFSYRGWFQASGTAGEIGKRWAHSALQAVGGGSSPPLGAGCQPRTPALRR